MNAKKCKMIRKMLRSAGIDPTEKRYTEPRASIFQVIYTRTLDKRCGRAAYLNAKAMAA